MKHHLSVLILMATIGGNAVADQLDDIKARKTLVCGVFGDLVPLGYEDSATRQTVGFDVDICTELANSLGVKPEVKTLSVAARIPALATGRVDVVAAALGYNATRAKQIEFSSAYYQTPIPVMVMSQSGINNFNDLKAKKISAIRGSTPELYARQQLEKSEITTFDDGPSAFLALQQNKVQGMAMSLSGAIGFRNRSGDTTRFLDEVLHWEPDCIGVKKDELALLGAVNASLDEMEKSGKLQVIWDKWFGPATEYKLKREKKVTPLSEFQ